ncbi:MAG TPA: prepilin-type N-terminal cleavage/methylation domain-containing protein [Elusimicrobiota bacterium]|jgi:prepilin-type N-terminal cleavage/methylation domain-containing protein|nr:prepilin-type N-terminal cleavage/methylation domain-containing protein [Elusimicrobiota bacterium]
MASDAARRGGRALERAFTLVELLVVSTVLAILVGYSIPKFYRALEQTQVDLAAANLELIWSAQRLYYAQNRSFAASISDLQTAGLLDQSFVTVISKPDAKMAYAIAAADASSFEATATRSNSGHWSGTLTINEQGSLTGQINGIGGEVVSPPST